MKAETLKQLSKKLELSEAVLKGIKKGDKRKGGHIVSNNMAKCLGNICKRTGYKTKQAAEKAIEGNIKLLYISAEDFGRRVQRLAERTKSKQRAELLQKAASFLLAGNPKSFVKLIAKDPSLIFLKRKCVTKVDDALLDTFRNQPKQNRKTAKAVLMATGAGGEKILVKQSAINSAIRRRLKRYGAVSSLFWEAAIAFNPKVKIKGLAAAKKKPQNKTRGASSRTSVNAQGYMAEIAHHLEKDAPVFKAKINKIISDTEKYWAKMTEKEIIAYMYLDKYLGE